MQKLAHTTDIHTIQSKYPKEVINDILEMLTVLDNEYGASRNVEEDFGGYLLIIDSEEEFLDLYPININIDTVIAEFVDIIKIPEKEDWIIALIQMSDDYFITLVFPRTIAPENIVHQIGL